MTQTAHITWDTRLEDGGHVSTQAELVGLEGKACRLRTFSMTFVAGLLQTPDYARAVFTQMEDLHQLANDDLDGAVAGRMQRQQVLDDAAKDIEIILDESTMRRVVGSTEIMRTQLDRLTTMVDHPRVRVGILPCGPSLATSPQNSFALHDDTASVEMFVGEVTYNGDQAAAYHRIMDRLWQDAATGAQARQLIAQAAEALPDAAQRPGG